MATPVVGLNAFLPWGPVVIAGIGGAIGCIYAQLSATRRRIKDAQFDTGPNGLATFYLWLQESLLAFLRWTVFLLVAEIIGFQASRWVNLRHSYAMTISQITFGALALVGLYTGFCLGRALVYGRFWLALEWRGMRYDVRDHQRYRVRFVHKSGAKTVDDTPWEARIQAEQEGLSQNDDLIQQQLKALLVQGLRIAIWYLVIVYATEWARHLQFEGFFGDVIRGLGSLSAYYRLDRIAPAIVAAQHLATPFATFVVGIVDRLAYAFGAQFASLVHVKDDADTRTDLKDVVGQTATGNAGFATRAGRRKPVGS